MANGRGAWNVSGSGGTKQYKDATNPGPYYYLGTGYNANINDPNEHAVKRAVMAYQKALNRRLDLDLIVDGNFGQETYDAVFAFQSEHQSVVGAPWGGIGPQTSETLLLPDLRRVWRKNAVKQLPLVVVTGTIRRESNWDAGAVGYLDPRDVGLAQINADSHPTWSSNKRLRPVVCFKFMVDYYNDSLAFFNFNLEDAIASYNLGKGGVQRWISQGRPEWYTPEGQSNPRNVREYIREILRG